MAYALRIAMKRKALPQRWRWLAFVVELAGCSLIAQPEAPILQLLPTIDLPSFTLQIACQTGWYYTWQGSSDLSNWSSLSGVFADTEELRWTGSISTQLGPQFYRVKVNAPNTAVVTNYNGWKNAVLLNNGIVETVIVPAAGRVLQFRFLGSTNGPFWENRNLYGRTANSSSWNTEGSFGGDKAWPSPQSDWVWPPPLGFDGSSNAFSINHGVVTLVTPTNTIYAIRTSRVIELAFDEPVMRITTIFERTAPTSWTNKPVGIWVVTQAQDPVGCYVPVPSPSIFTNGYVQLGSGMPAQFRNTNGLISFIRDKGSDHKLGFDAGVIVWVGTNVSLRIEAPRLAGLDKSAYPDKGSSTEIYTYPSPTAPYVELELLGPLAKLQVGARMEFVTTYTLFSRTETKPDDEARKVLGLQQQ
jgi:hypothetical protein